MSLLSSSTEETEGNTLPERIDVELQKYNAKKLDPQEPLTTAQRSYFSTSKSTRATIEVLNAGIMTRNELRAKLRIQIHQLGPEEALFPLPIAPAPVISSSSNHTSSSNEPVEAQTTTPSNTPVRTHATTSSSVDDIISMIAKLSPNSQTQFAQSFARLQASIQTNNTNASSSQVSSSPQQTAPGSSAADVVPVNTVSSTTPQPLRMNLSTPDSRPTLYIKGYMLDHEKIRSRFPRKDNDPEINYEFTYYGPIIDNIPETAYKYVQSGMGDDGKLRLVFVIEHGYDKTALDGPITPPDDLPRGALNVLTPGVWQSW